MSRKKQKNLKKRKMRCAVYGIAGLLLLAAGLFLRRSAVGIVSFGLAAAALFFCVNAWFRLVHRGVRNLIGAAMVAASLVCLFVFFVGVGGRLFPADTRTLTLSELSGVSDLNGVGRMRDLQTLDVRNGGFVGSGDLMRSKSLTFADLRGNTLTLREEMALKTALPQCDFLWDVPLSSGNADCAAQEIVLTGEDAATEQEVSACLALFAGPSRVVLQDINLDLDAYGRIQAAWPDVAFEWQAEVGGALVGSGDDTLRPQTQLSVDELLSALDGLPDVKTLDLALLSYTTDELRAVTQARPDLTLLWQSSVNGADCGSDTEDLNLTGRAVDMDTLYWLADHMPRLKTLTLYDVDLPVEALNAFVLERTNLTVYREAKIGDTELDAAVEELDLSGQTLDYDETAAALSALPALKNVNLTDCSLTEEEKRALCDRMENVTFLWTMDLYGQQAATDATKLRMPDAQIDDVDALIADLKYFKSLTYLDMTNCSLSDEELARLRDACPDKGVVWTLHIGIYSVRTNATAFSTFHVGTGTEPYYTSADFSVLKYCTRMLALDVGHNSIDDLTWLTEMPQLKVLILADNKIKDIRPLAQMKNLEYLELFVNYITDVSPLAGLDKLIDLNLGFNNFGDVEPLMGLTGLERLWLTNNYITYADQIRLLEALPNTHCDFNSETAVAGGWRTHKRYDILYEMFKNGYYIDWDGNIMK